MKNRFYALVVFCILLLAMPARAFWPFGSDVPETPFVTQEKTLERAAEEIIREDWSETALSWPKERRNRVKGINLINGQEGGGSALHIYLRLDGKSTPQYFLVDVAWKMPKPLIRMAKDERFKEVKEYRLFCAIPDLDDFYVIKANYKRQNVLRMHDTMDVVPFFALANQDELWIHGKLLQ